MIGLGSDNDREKERNKGKSLRSCSLHGCLTLTSEIEWTEQGFSTRKELRKDEERYERVGKEQGRDLSCPGSLSFSAGDPVGKVIGSPRALTRSPPCPSKVYVIRIVFWIVLSYIIGRSHWSKTWSKGSQRRISWPSHAVELDCFDYLEILP